MGTVGEGGEGYTFLFIKERSHRDERDSMENVVNNIAVTLYGDRSNFTYHGKYLYHI